ncbi:MAG: protein kinase [Planctomycetota bacterium]|nr:protein kinase [Planctomycetota bacterium]
MIDLHCLHPACGKPIQVDPSAGSDLVECQECRSEFIVIEEKGDFRLRPTGTTTMTAGAFQQSRGAPGPSEFPQANVQPVESVSRLLNEKKSALAQYEIQKQVAQGGMGAVFQCLDKGLNRPVAMKVMLPEVAARELNAIRFLNEAQITGQMEHPNIVPVHELGVDEEGATFFTMKLVQGKTLNDVIKDNRSSWEGNADAESVSLPGLLNNLLKACDAIAFAHSRGVIHRDLKPQNIMIGEFGEVLVMDWGLAKVIRGPEGEQQDSPSDQLLQTLNLEAVSNQSTVMANPEESSPSGSATMEGTVAGTPSYMPPEQARGLISELDERSDIYSLGAILYEMLTLEKPVPGQTRTEILMRTAEGRIVPPVERRKDRDISTELSAIAMKAMAGEKEDRYPTVKAFSRDIQLYLEGRTVSAKEDSFLEASLKLMRRNRGVSGMAFIAAASIAVLSAWFILHLRVERDLARDSAIEADRLRVRADTEHRHQMEHASKASEALARQAMRAADQGRLGEAEARADTTIKMFPIGPWGHYALAYIMRLKGNIQSAREHLENALEIDRDHLESQALQASLSDDEGSLSHALDLVSGAKSSTDWRALNESGIVLHKAKKFDKAAQLFERALNLMRAGKSLPKPATIADVQYRMDRSIVEFRCVGNRVSAHFREIQF